MISVSKEKYPAFNFIPSMFKEIGHILQREIHDQELRSLHYLGYHENSLIVLSLKYFKNFFLALRIKIMLCYLKFHFKQ